MNILFLNYEFPPLGGGAGNATYYMFKEFAKTDNLNIDLITSSVDKFRIEDFADNIKIHYLDIGKKGNFHYQTNKDLLSYSFKAHKYAKALIKKKKFDLCHAFFGIPCGYIAMKLGLSYIVSLRGSDVPFYNKRFYWLDKFIFKRLSRKIWRKSSAVIANSVGLKKLAIKSAPMQEISVICNGVDIEEFCLAESNKFSKSLSIISTGRLIARKGFQFLIPALKGLDVELCIIGDGPMISELESLSDINKVKVYFTGKKRHSEIALSLRKSDLFVLPSLNEGMSNSVLEAMACGLPIVATDTGGSNELVKDNGFIIEKGSSEAIKNAVKKYLDNPELLKMHSNNSRKLAENMSWNKCAVAYCDFYFKIGAKHEN
jgi:glycosyltransferase involved in cell wall biosynthesis